MTQSLAPASPLTHNTLSMTTVASPAISVVGTPMKASPVILAGGSIQSMVTEPHTPGPSTALIAATIGGTLGGLVVVFAIFFAIYRIRRLIQSSDTHAVHDDEIDRMSRMSHITPASSRPVSTFSDTTVDSHDARARTRRILRRRSSTGLSLKSLKNQNPNTGGGNHQVISIDHLEAEADRVPFSSLSSPTSSATLSPAIHAPHHTRDYSSRQPEIENRGMQPFQAHSQLAFPPPSQPAMHSIGGYATALQRAGGSLGPSYSPPGQGGTGYGTGQRAGTVQRVAAEIYEETGRSERFWR
ncbi:hypothetical protein JCM16303_005534 [Sporobolomyces ruberrimus]